MYYVVTYTRTHAPQVPVLLARRGPNLTCARQPAPARCSNNPEASIHPRDGALALHRLGPSVRPSAASLLLWLRKCGNTQATVHLNSIQVEDREGPRNLHRPRKTLRCIYLLFSPLSLT